MSQSSHEAVRLAALRYYQILDTAPEQTFDQVTRFAGVNECFEPVFDAAMRS